MSSTSNTPIQGIFEEFEDKFNRKASNKEKEKIIKQLDMPKNDEGYYIDAFGGRVSFDGARQIKSEFTNFEMTEIHKREIKRCKQSFEYFYQNYCKIRTPTEGITYPEIRDYQVEMLDSFIAGDDVVLLSGRQSGKTTLTAMYMTWIALTKENLNAGIAGNRAKTARKILQDVKTIFILLPIWLQNGVRKWNAGEIVLDNGTKIMTDATSENSFRGETMDFVFVDELAFIPQTQYSAFEDSIFPSQSGLAWKQNILTSTPKGLNHWYHICEKAKKSDDTSFIYVDPDRVPRYDKNANKLTAQQFKDNILNKYGKMYWLQNYQAEFLGSSHTLVDSQALKALDVTEEDDYIISSLFDELRVLEAPIQGHNYVIGVDPAKDGVDDFALQVIDISSFPFKQVAIFNSGVSYLNMPGRLFDLGMYYNEALIVVENNLDQYVVDTLFYNYDYDNVFRQKDKKIFGFRTTTRSKKIILSFIKKFIETGRLQINDRDSIDQLFVFVEQKNGSFSAEDGYKDDLVMALAVCFAPFLDVKNFEDYDDFVAILDFDNVQKEEDDRLLEEFLDLGFAEQADDAQFVENEDYDFFSYSNREGMFDND